MADNINTNLFLDGLDKEIQQRIDSINALIESVSSKANLGGVEVIKQLLQFSSDPKEINRLAKALALVAKELPELNKLKKRHQVLEVASKDQDWFEIAFNNSKTVEFGIQKILEEHNGN